MRFRTSCLALAACVTIAAGWTHAQDADPAPINARAQELVKALTGGDADALANFWTPTGEYARDAVTIRGRDNIRKAYAEHFKMKTTGKLTIAESSVRFLSDSVAVQEGVFTVNRDNPADNVRNKFSVLYLKIDGTWHVGMLREQSEGPALAELEWMVGDWAFKTENVEGTMSVQFTKKKTYLLVQTRVKDVEDEEVATQIIGIDPASGKLKSWTFESDGSIGTAEWVRTEKGWLANITATTADGEPVKAVRTLTPTSLNEFTYLSTERSVDGEKLADSTPVKVTRVTK